MLLNYEVICPGCGGSFHDISDKFDPNASSHTGDMFVLKEQYGPSGFNWTAFPNNDGIRCGDLECPDCQAPYCSGGFKVKIREIKPPFIPVISSIVFDDDIQDVVDDVVDDVIEFHTGRTSPIPDTKHPLNDANVCDRCGKLCKSYAGLIAHKRFCKK